ncbi:phospholipid-transporting ATPase 1, partial [Trichinella spiralis]|uniref:phospholipid-transporting ATPase 1 n=1 Tax=Trichinella spiralis TaxID=6334 RepID=UPI0001EFEBC8
NVTMLIEKLTEAKCCIRFGRWVDELWENVNVGDLVKIVDGQFFPADLVLLSSSEPQAMAYVETSNLDGETNLKLRQGSVKTAHLLSHETLGEFFAYLDCEPPNRQLYELSGKLTLPDITEIPLGPDQLLLRGSLLKNTQWIFGVVIYTGHEPKLMLNSNVAPADGYLRTFDFLILQLSLIDSYCL